MTEQRRSRSVSVDRLSQSLPPLPNFADAISSHTPYRDEPERTPYRDDPEPPESQPAEEDQEDGERETVIAPADPESQPPEYQPMYDYLRSKTPDAPDAPETYGSSPLPLCLAIESVPQVPYRDEPTEELLDESEAPPPSYHDVYREHDIELGNLGRDSGLAGGWGRKEQAEDIFKWLIAMLIIILTIAAVGTAFNWGKLF